MKKFMVAVLASALLVGVGTGMSYAYLTARDGAVNQFQASSVDVEIEEEFKPPGDLKPGNVIKKAPTVKSSSNADCYVRVRVRFTDSDAENACEPLQINAGWQEEDGYYYWTEPLHPGESTGALFDSVHVKADAKEIPPFDILVYAEAVLCSQKTMKEAWEDYV